MTHSCGRCSDWANNGPCGRKNWKVQQPWEIVAPFEVDDGMFPNIVFNLHGSNMKLKADTIKLNVLGMRQGHVSPDLGQQGANKLTAHSLSLHPVISEKPSQWINSPPRIIFHQRSYETYWCFVSGFFKLKRFSVTGSQNGQGHFHSMEDQGAITPSAE